MIEINHKLFAVMKPSLTRRFVYGYVYGVARRLLALESKSVLLESHHGKYFGGNPYHIALHMTLSPAYHDFRLILVAPAGERTRLRRRFSGRNVVIVAHGSLRYALHLATSKWLINDVAFPLYFSKRHGQAYLNTWHGTPLKTLGRHAETDAALHLVNVQRNFLQSDFILAPNYHTEMELFDGYCLPGLYSGSVLRFGYPRNDVLQRSFVRRVEQTAVNIAYMPTWRGGLTDRRRESKQQLDELICLLDALDAAIPSNATLWLKLHPQVNGYIPLERYRSIRLFPDDLETYEHLATCDVLITDYSSVMFDFAITRRPILRYAPDQASYGAGRGFCLDPADLPFPVSTSPSELIQQLDRCHVIRSTTLEPATTEALEEFVRLERGSSAKDVCEAFFMATSTPRPPVAEGRRRPRVAIYLGESALGIAPDRYAATLEMLDSEKFHFVLLLDADFLTPRWNAVLKELHPDFSFVVVRFNAYVDPAQLMALGWPRRPELRIGTFRKIAEAECRRLFGQTRLDILVNLGCPGPRSSVLELGQDWQRKIDVCAEKLVSKGQYRPQGLEEYFRANPGPSEEHLQILGSRT